jgi:hypothetical protein
MPPYQSNETFSNVGDFNISAVPEYAIIGVRLVPESTPEFPEIRLRATPEQQHMGSSAVLGIVETSFYAQREQRIQNATRGISGEKRDPNEAYIV